VTSGRTKGFELAEERLEIPERAARCGIDVILKEPGTVRIDSASIAIPGAGPPELGPLELANPGFEDGLRSWELLPHGSGATEATEDRHVRAEGKCALRLERASPRHLPEDGLRAAAAELGKARKAKLTCAVRVEGAARGIVVLQAFDARGVALAAQRLVVEPTGERFAPQSVTLELPKGAARLDVLLCIAGAGTVWFDELELGKG
jgi:hypothetical protein